MMIVGKIIVVVVVIVIVVHLNGGFLCMIVITVLYQVKVSLMFVVELICRM